jgi:ATP-dependent helicase/nuclease subunit B
VRSGAGAEGALVRCVARAQASDPLAPVTVVVRSSVVGLDLRRRLAERGAFAGVRFLPMARLVELLGAPQVGAGRVGGGPLSPASLGAAIRVALRESPGVLSDSADHPSTEASLARTYRMLRPLSEGDRRALTSMSTRARDVVHIVERVRQMLASTRYDLEDLAEAAASALSDPAVDLSPIGDVVVHLPDPLPPSQSRLLAKLADHVAVSVLVAEVGEPVADAATDMFASDLFSLGFEPASPAEPPSPVEPAPLLEPPSPAESGPSQAPISRVIAAPDVEEEVRTVARLLAAHAEGGGDLGRVAVAVPSGEGGRRYLPLIGEVLSLAGIPWTSPSSATVAETPRGRLLLDLVDLLLESERPLDRGAVIGWLSSPVLESDVPLMARLSFLAADGAAPLGAPALVPAGEFDRCSRRAGVVFGADEWDRRLGRPIRRREGVDEQAEAEVTLASDLRTIVHRLHRRAIELAGARTWAEVASLAAGLVTLVLPADDDAHRLADAFETLEELDGLEALVPAAANPDGARERQLRSALSQALSAPSAGQGRFGAGPVVAPITALAGLRADLLVLLGCREGLLPGRTPEDPLVTEIERGSVRLLARAERAEHRDRRHLLCLLAGVEDAVAVYSRVDRGASRPSYPSRWLAGDLFVGSIDEIASFPASLDAVAAGRMAPADRFDVELAAANERVARHRRLDGLFVADIDDVGRRLRAEQERRSAIGFSRFAGHVGLQPRARAVYDDVVSATRIEDLAKCPLRFMFGRLTRIEVLDAPERLDTIAASDRGTLIHGVLEQFVTETAIGRESFDGWSEADRATLGGIAEAHFASAEASGLTGKSLYWQMERAQVLADLERFVAIESDRLVERGGRPLRTEHGFGYGDVPPVEIEVGNGASLRFRGRIDRIDVEPQGRIRVVDYKSGGGSSYIKMAEDPLGGGSHLQLPIYAKAAAALAREVAPVADALGGGDGDVVAEYRFCSAASGFGRVPVELTSRLDRELSGVLATLGGLIDGGTFPPRPGGEDRQDNCRYCDFAAACRLDRSVMWVRASTEPSLERYVALVGGARTEEVTS